MKIEKSTAAQIPQIMKMIDDARIVMKEMNIDQWQNDKDGNNAVLNESIVLDDIKNGNSYVVLEDDKILCHGTVIFGEDETYKIIKDGYWQSNASYGTIHRVATCKDLKQKGIANFLLTHFERVALKNEVEWLRIDTHKDNIPMLNLVKKLGYTKSGIIFVADGTERIVFEKKLK